MTQQKTFEDVLYAWAADMPEDMQSENTHDKLLDSFLRLFEQLSAANIKSVPPFKKLISPLKRAVHWQWIALNIPMPPLVGRLAPHALSLMIVRWLTIWQSEKTNGNPRLLTVIDRDLARLDAAAQYCLRR